jgi:hypothetical protein
MILSLRQVVNIGCIAAALLCSANLSVAEQEIPLHSFCDPTLQAECGATGAGAQGLIRDNAGNYYGVAGFEGTQAAGAIYSWSSSSGYNQLYSFCHEPCQEGDGPQGLLVLDANGNLYGTTTDGGSLAVEDPPGYGVVYKLSVSAPSQYFHLWDFCKIDLNCPEGSHPTAGLTYVGAASGKSLRRHVAALRSNQKWRNLRQSNGVQDNARWCSSRHCRILFGGEQLPTRANAECRDRR